MANCFLPNAYDLVDCSVSRLGLSFADSHTLNVDIAMVLTSRRDVVPEIYGKDDWKAEEAWGDTTNKDLAPLLFVFAGKNGSVSSRETAYQRVNIVERHATSHMHWHVWMPYSRMVIEQETVFDPQARRMVKRGYRCGKGKVFSGKNTAIFGNVYLNTELG
ncbi:MAG TPA: hypothetical protein VGL40_00510 [Bacillota bacterium]